VECCDDKRGQSIERDVVGIRSMRQQQRDGLG
jgi:hypothetical protein